MSALALVAVAVVGPLWADVSEPAKTEALAYLEPAIELARSMPPGPRRC